MTSEETRGFPAQIDGLEIYTEADGYVVYQATQDKVHFLNATAVFVLELCNGRHEVHEMADIFGETFKDEKNPEKAVTDIVNQFVQEGLVKIGE